MFHLHMQLVEVKRHGKFAEAEPPRVVPGMAALIHRNKMNDNHEILGEYPMFQQTHIHDSLVKSLFWMVKSYKIPVVFHHPLGFPLVRVYATAEFGRRRLPASKGALKKVWLDPRRSSYSHKSHFSWIASTIYSYVSCMVDGLEHLKK